MKIALQLYSVRENTEKDFLGTLKKVKEMGYDGGELAGTFGYSGKEIKDMFANVGLIPISAHVPYQVWTADMNGTLKLYKEIGCKYIAIPYLTEEYRYGGEKYAQVVEDIKKIGKLCADNGITLMYHNHDFEFEKAENGKYALDLIYEAISPELLKTELDTCWVNVGGEDPANFILKYAGRAPVVHLKDFDGEKSDNMYELIGIDGEKREPKNTFEFRPLGLGKQDFTSIIKASKDAGAEWVIVEQDEPSMGKSPLECAKISIDYMKKIGY